jgi:hypothetical protein
MYKKTLLFIFVSIFTFLFMGATQFAATQISQSLAKSSTVKKSKPKVKVELSIRHRRKGVDYSYLKNGARGIYLFIKNNPKVLGIRIMSIKNKNGKILLFFNVHYKSKIIKIKPNTIKL